MLSYQETERCQEKYSCECFHFFCSAKTCLKSWKTNQF